MLLIRVSLEFRTKFSQSLSFFLCSCVLLQFDKVTRKGELISHSGCAKKLNCCLTIHSSTMPTTSPSRRAWACNTIYTVSHQYRPIIKKKKKCLNKIIEKIRFFAKSILYFFPSIIIHFLNVSFCNFNTKVEPTNIFTFRTQNIPFLLISKKPSKIGK